MPPKDADDPVAREIEALKRALLGGLEEYQKVNLERVDQAELLARDARGSRPKMPATRPGETTGTRHKVAASSDLQVADITSKFGAIRARR